MGVTMVNRVKIIKGVSFLAVIFPMLLLGAGCVSTGEIKTISADIQDNKKMIGDLLDRLSIKDQEIGRLHNKLNTATMTIENLKKDIEQLREVDVQMEEKKKEVDIQIEETIPEDVLGTPPGTDSVSIEEPDGSVR
jgi:septal ring factor EnvC (AmiA/AmiB activator)